MVLKRWQLSCKSVVAISIEFYQITIGHHYEYYLRELRVQFRITGLAKLINAKTKQKARIMVAT